MTFTTLALTLSLTASAAAPAKPATTTSVTPPVITRVVETPIRKAAPTPVAQPSLQKWMVDAPQRRPAALSALYATFGALQVADVMSTRKALNAGAIEANPLMRSAAKSSGTMYAVKAVTSAASIYFAEKAWKKNRKGAVIMMAVVNGVTAAVVSRNMRNAR